jgi:hypothetical protein
MSFPGEVSPSHTDDTELVESRSCLEPVDIDVDESLSRCACRLEAPAGSGAGVGEVMSLRSLRPAASILTPSLRPPTTDEDA